MEAYDLALHAHFSGAVSLHFGQLYPSEAANARRTVEAHPGLRRFDEVRRELDPKGRFLNPFHSRLLVGP
jgi:FAD/FMN-containing dehydrogenase